MKFDFKSNHPKGPYEGLPHSQWTDWKWQNQNALRTERDFSALLSLTEEEKAGFVASEGLFKIRTTPYYAQLAIYEPIRRMQLPHVDETRSRTQEMRDPLGEKKNAATGRLIHRYADRVLFLITDFCSTYCRYCTRKHFTGQGKALADAEEYAVALEYIRSQPGVREVLLSGGDPLTIGDEKLERILFDLRSIEHVEVVRVGSRMLAANPFRVTDELVRMLKKYKPVFFMAHFNHPLEITQEAAIAIEKLVDGGVPVMNQMVLLNGVNNHASIVRELSRRLLYLRAKPYYMFQCDPSLGTDHLRTSIRDSLEIQKELWGHLSGLAMPTFSVDIPNGGGKAGFVPNFVLPTSTDRHWYFRGYDGVESVYIDPSPEHIMKPKPLL